MSDLIDRNDAVEAIEFEKVYITAYKGNSNGYVSEGNPFKQYNKGLDDAIKVVNSLASAKPERKKGEWIVTSEFKDCRYVKCNQCKVTQVFYYNKSLTNFCPNCGADMRGGNE